MPSITNYTETLRPFSGYGMQRRAHPLVFVALGLICVSTMFHEEYCRFVDRLTFSQAQTWPTVVGQTTKYSTDPVSIRDSKYSSHTEYRVHVDFNYLVNGQKYFATQDKFLRHENRMDTNIFNWKDWSVTYQPSVEKMLASEYSHSTSHSVRYDKSDPAKAMLEVEMAPDGPRDQSRRTMLFGAFLLTVFAILLVQSGITKMR